jgi:hypothetical protein
LNNFDCGLKTQSLSFFQRFYFCSSGYYICGETMMLGLSVYCMHSMCLRNGSKNWSTGSCIVIKEFLNFNYFLHYFFTISILDWQRCINLSIEFYSILILPSFLYHPFFIATYSLSFYSYHFSLLSKSQLEGYLSTISSNPFADPSDKFQKEL